MNPLDTQRLFLDCPYPVKQDGSEYTFKTEHDIVYSVDFKEEQTFSLFFIKTAQVTDDGIDNFIAIIVPRQHQYLNEIIARFDAEIAMFQSNKPE
jgi:hypothetical protein